MSQGHVDTVTSNGLILGIQTGVEDLYCLLVRIDSEIMSYMEILKEFIFNCTSFVALAVNRCQ